MEGSHFLALRQFGEPCTIFNTSLYFGRYGNCTKVDVAVQGVGEGWGGMGGGVAVG